MKQKHPFWLPWPPPKLSPNARKHWRTVAGAKQRYRRECYACGLMQAELTPLTFNRNQRFEMRLTFTRPRDQHYDLDNLLARMKAGLDGLCDALGLNDRNARPVTVDYVEPVVSGGRVLVELIFRG